MKKNHKLHSTSDAFTMQCLNATLVSLRVPSYDRPDFSNLQPWPFRFHVCCFTWNTKGCQFVSDTSSAIISHTENYSLVQILVSQFTIWVCLLFSRDLSSSTRSNSSFLLTVVFCIPVPEYVSRYFSVLTAQCTHCTSALNPYLVRNILLWFAYIAQEQIYFTCLFWFHTPVANLLNLFVLFS